MLKLGAQSGRGIKTDQSQKKPGPRVTIDNSREALLGNLQSCFFLANALPDAVTWYQKKGVDTMGFTKAKKGSGITVVYWVIFAFLLALAAFLLFYKLGSMSIINLDEALYGVNAYEMDQSNEWIVNTFRGEPDYKSLMPPLAMWLIRLGYRLFGYSAFGLRAYSAISMLMAAVVLVLWVKRRHGMVASLFAMALLVCNNAIYIGHFARFGDKDALYFLFFTGAMLFMLDSSRNIRWLYGTAVCFGLAFLTKGWHSVMIPATCLVYLLVTGEFKKLKPRHYLGLVALGLLLIVPWAILRYQRDGVTFFVRGFIQDVQGGLESANGRVGAGGQVELFAYVWFLLLERAGPITAVVACLMGVLLLIARKKRPSLEYKGFLAWVLVVPILYSCFPYKNFWYVYPVMAGLAVAGGVAMGGLWRAVRGRKLARAGVVAVAVALLVQGGALVNQISNTPGAHTFQRTIAYAVDREVDSGVRVYIQYENGPNWSDGDLLCAMLAGDVTCVDGGIEAFTQDEEEALLILAKECMTNELAEYYAVALDNGPVLVLEN